MIYRQGDVVLLPFPPTDLNRSASKNRPAVIISADWFFFLRGDYIVVALTSQPKRDCFDIIIHDYLGAGLLKPTVARIGKYITVHPAVIIKRLGTLGEFDKETILGRIPWVFNPP